MESALGPFAGKSIDEVRSYWNARPCNIRHSQKPLGSREYFDEVEARKYFVEPHIPDFAEFARWQGKRVLEIGCGLGTDTVNFARAGALVTAVDLSDESLAMARKRVEVFGLADWVRFHQANAERLSETVPVETYDLVYSFGVIHHTPYPEAVIAEIRKYMGPESVFKMMVYNRRSWKVLWILASYGRFAFWRLDELIARCSEAQTGCPVTYSYTRQSVKGLLAGMDVTRTRAEHIFPYSIPEYKRHEYKKVWYFRWLPDKAFHWLERRLGWHLCLDARLRRDDTPVEVAGHGR